jgi:predicted nucleic acid-binding Zn ribbon protein
MGYVSLMDGHIDNAEHCVCCGQVIPEGSQYCIVCGYKVKQPKKRQIDRIRNMDTEDLANFLYTISNCEMNLCDECPLECCGNEMTIKQWLEQEVEE